ncbi:hypothetical protein NL676_007127 [Syzygium grande]|nr:hypothetical protein NL676_007127 [Syzygium grande]
MRTLVEFRRKEKGSGMTTTKIQNKSESTIFLIPIFCTGNDIEKFRKTLAVKVFKVETVEHLFLHDELFAHDLELKCHEGKDIGDGSVVQVAQKKKKKEDKEDIQKPVTLQILADLIMAVLAEQGGLKEDIKALQEKMESLKKA